MMNKKYDKISIGALAGMVVPVLVFGLLFILFEELNQLDVISDEGFSPGFRLRTISLVSIGANAILVRFFQNRYAFQAVRGVVFPTFVYIIVWIVYFSSVLF